MPSSIDGWLADQVELYMRMICVCIVMYRSIRIVACLTAEISRRGLATLSPTATERLVQVHRGSDAREAELDELVLR